MTNDRFIDLAALERSLASVREQVDEGELGRAMHQVVVAAKDVFAASGAGLMLIDEGSVLAAVAASDAAGMLLETSQEQHGHGPCVDAVTFDQIVTTEDLACDERWPMLLPELPDAGVRAVLGVPVHIDRVPVGSLNLYRDRPGGWGEHEPAALQAYTTLIESLLRTALHARERQQLADQLQNALANRVVIDRAVGVIMARSRVGEVEAFNELRRQARDAGRKVADVAAELLADVPDRRR